MVRWAFCEWNKQINKVVYTGVLVSKGSLLTTLEETNNPLMKINEIPPQLALVNPLVGENDTLLALHLMEYRWVNFA